MKKELFKLIVAEFEKLGVNPTQWFGTRGHQCQKTH